MIIVAASAIAFAFAGQAALTFVRMTHVVHRTYAAASVDVDVDVPLTLAAAAAGWRRGSAEFKV